MDKIFKNLDKVYMQEKDWRKFHVHLNLKKYKRAGGRGVHKCVDVFDLRVFKNKECVIELPDAILPCRLLKNCSLMEVCFQLPFSTCPKLKLVSVCHTLNFFLQEPLSFLLVLTLVLTSSTEKSDVLYTSTRG